MTAQARRHKGEFFLDETAKEPESAAGAVTRGWLRSLPSSSSREGCSVTIRG